MISDLDSERTQKALSQVKKLFKWFGTSNITKFSKSPNKLAFLKRTMFAIKAWLALTTRPKIGLEKTRPENQMPLYFAILSEDKTDKNSKKKRRLLSALDPSQNIVHAVSYDVDSDEYVVSAKSTNTAGENVFTSISKDGTVAFSSTTAQFSKGRKWVLIVDSFADQTSQISLLNSIHKAHRAGCKIAIFYDESITKLLNSGNETDRTKSEIYLQSIMFADLIVFSNPEQECLVYSTLRTEFSFDSLPGSLVCDILELPAGSTKSVWAARKFNRQVALANNCNRANICIRIIRDDGQQLDNWQNLIVSSLKASGYDVLQVSPENIKDAMCNNRFNWLLTSPGNAANSLKTVATDGDFKNSASLVFVGLEDAIATPIDEILLADRIIVTCISGYEILYRRLLYSHERTPNIENRLILLERPSSMSVDARSQRELAGESLKVCLYISDEASISPPVVEKLDAFFEIFSAKRNSIELVIIQDNYPTPLNVDESLAKINCEQVTLTGCYSLYDLQHLQNSMGSHVWLYAGHHFDRKLVTDLADHNCAMLFHLDYLDHSFIKKEKEAIWSEITDYTCKAHSAFDQCTALEKLENILGSPPSFLPEFGTRTYSRRNESSQKESSRPLLTLCISTYNRSAWLDLNISSIYKYFDLEKLGVELLVVDNTSSDSTPKVLKKYAKYPNFRGIRNPKNVGILGNLAVSALNASGQHIWIIGDDDLIRPGALEKICDVLRSHRNIDLVYLNYGYSSEKNPDNVKDLDAYLEDFSVLEPKNSDEYSTVIGLSAKTENFYTAIFSNVYRRDHAVYAYCQDTKGRIFSTLATCVPSSNYAFNHMVNLPAYWIGEQCIVVNSNVSWQAYGTLFDLEHIPRIWDLSDVSGAPLDTVEQRRSDRLWLVELMWKQAFELDIYENSPYLDTARIIMRLKHLNEMKLHAPVLKQVYADAQSHSHPLARWPLHKLFRAL